jgi:hypothetical protein
MNKKCRVPHPCDVFVLVERVENLNAQSARSRESPRSSCYDGKSMWPDGTNRRHFKSVLRAVVEIAFIVFLFYSNLLMGEFTVTNGQGKSFAAALSDILTVTNFAIAIASALVGYVVFEHLRKKL